MTACPDRLLLLQALVDGELDAANSVVLEAHLKSCGGCTGELRRIEALHAALVEPALHYETSASLAGRIQADIARESGSAPRFSAPPNRVARAPWFAGGMVTALAASLALFVAVPRLTASGVEDQLIASHVRSLLANHLTDVATSDRHVVKPWFNGRIDFAPPVVELADQGFPLVGGRLDYIGGRVVPAIVYSRRLHSINLFVRPAGALVSPVGIATQRNGYSLMRWTRNGLEYWAVSDVDPGELRRFQELFLSRSATAPSR